MSNKNPKSGLAQGIYEGSDLVDIIVERGAKSLAILGAGNAARELALMPCDKDLAILLGQKTLDAFVAQPQLPVLIGSGVGYLLEKLVETLAAAWGDDFSLAIVDQEADILAVNECKKRFSRYSGIVWITAATSQEVLIELTQWQNTHSQRALYPIVHPFYLRLNREYYKAIHDACSASSQSNFWEKAQYTKFSTSQPRILLLTSKYFLMGEIVAACKRLNVSHHLLTVPDGAVGKSEFVEQLLQAIVAFKPDFVFTLNHLGVDREGVLISLLEQLHLPLASWFVDNPHLVLHMYSKLASPWTAIFSWDEDNITSVQELGFSHVYYLPLGTDVTRFLEYAKREPKISVAPQWKTDISFVGNSMVSKVVARMEYGEFPPELLNDYKEVAAAFSASEERSVRTFLEKEYTNKVAYYDALDSYERKLAYETMLTWEATLQYRLSCVQAIVPFSPLIVGDKGWFDLLPANGWRYHSELNYYTDLPIFYPNSQVNFNCTSKQMKGAVNQRVFDVPATGAFLLTDFREQIVNLFEPDKEVICYHTPEEATELANKFLRDSAQRQRIAQAARKRILAGHTYDHRLRQLMQQMQKTFG